MQKKHSKFSRSFLTMHEFSTMQQIVAAILEEARRQHATAIYRVSLEIGELTFLGEEQLRFAFQILTEGTLLAGAELTIETLKTEVRCSCGYRGGVDYGLKEEFHLSFPLLKCPRCGGDVDILSGRECAIKNVEMEVPNAGIEK
ncbi:MAG: hydrogenase maturation nickel metallochaperone HypA [Thermoplasmata archaeon]|nr:MAG: hydrogenase maturation nickel metallochaperone HypA [Thermoplasmata archaeon]